MVLLKPGRSDVARANQILFLTGGLAILALGHLPALP